MSHKNIAVVGIGNWGKNFVRVCYELGVLVAICDHNTKKADLFSFEYEVSVKSWPEILLDKRIEAVAIVLPANLHEKYAIEALKAGKHVFVEKPLAMSSQAAIEISKLAQAQKKIVMVGHILQYHNAYRKIKELIAQGIIGDIKYIESTRLHLGPVRPQIGILWELMPHDLSMILGIVKSAVTDVKVWQENLLNLKFENDRVNSDLIDVRLDFVNGIKARVCSSWLHPKKEQKFWVAGTLGMLIFDDTMDWANKLKLFIYNDYDDSVRQSGSSVILQECEPLRAEVEHFIYCINNGKTPRTDGREGANVVTLLEKIQGVRDQALAIL